LITVRVYERIVVLHCPWWLTPRGLLKNLNGASDRWMDSKIFGKKNILIFRCTAQIP